jgi:hypothetical protein
VCDGRARRATFVVDARERGSRGVLRSGVAWVRLRVDDERGLVLAHGGWVNVNRR